MIKVTMRVNIAGMPSYYIGEVVELEERIAKAWIAENMATLYRDEKPVERAVRG